MFRVPEGLPDDVAVLTEIFAVTHSLERAARLPSPAGFRPGSSVAVIGVGALGLAHAIKASLMGAGRIIAVDPSRRRLDLAARLAGAEPRSPPRSRDLTGGEGVDLVVNATGFPGSFAQALEMVRDGGLVIEVGAFVDMGEETFNPAVLCGRNLTMLGIGGEDLLVYEGTLALLARDHASSASRRWSRTASASGTRRRRWRRRSTPSARRRSSSPPHDPRLLRHPRPHRARHRLQPRDRARARGRAGGGGLRGRAARARRAGAGAGGGEPGADVHHVAFDVTDREAVDAGVRRWRRRSGRSTSSSTTPACSTARRCSSSPTTHGSA